MDRLAAMTAFRAVVEERGFARAAPRVGLSGASVSRLVAELEEHLGARLLHRTTRSVRPTDEGRVYYERCVRILDDLDDADERMRGARAIPRGNIRVTLAPALATETIAKLLPSFHACYPEVRVELDLDPRTVDLVREGFDLALRFKVRDWADSSLVARYVTTFAVRFVASPAYVAEHGRPAHPVELERHKVLVDFPRPEPATLTFEGPDGRHEVRVDGPVRTESSLVQRTLCLAGLGIAELPDYVAGEDLARGALVEVFPHHRIPPLELWAVTPPRSTLAARVRAFVDHVVAALGTGQRRP